MTIRYNALKYFEKPPFHMWVTALSYVVFGIGDWRGAAMRSLAGAIGLVASRAGCEPAGLARAALLTGLVLVAAPMWSVASAFQRAGHDAVESPWPACWRSSLLRSFPMPRPPRHPQLDASVLAGHGRRHPDQGTGRHGAAGLVLVIYTIIYRDLDLWRRRHLVSGVALMLLVAVPWFWLVSERNPEFLRFFFIHEHWQRATSSVHSRKGPLLYFVPLVLGGFLPWLGLVPRMARGARARRRDGRLRAAPVPARPARRHLGRRHLCLLQPCRTRSCLAISCRSSRRWASSAASRWIRSPNAPGAAAGRSGIASGQSGCWQALSSPR
ncbi:hypothetical protein ACTMU2_30770 [Cupriavidus basilensis]